MSNIIIREVKIEDAEDLLRIYAPYVKNTAITYEYDVPSLNEFKQRIKNITQKFPYLVAEIDSKIAGYCYAGVFHERKAYEHSCELSIYIEESMHKKGIGRVLYKSLEEELKKRGFKALYACIAATPRDKDKYLTPASIYFHSAAGFKKVGYFTSCAIKFDLWYDMVYMEKHI